MQLFLWHGRGSANLEGMQQKERATSFQQKLLAVKFWKIVFLKFLES